MFRIFNESNFTADKNSPALVNRFHGARQEHVLLRTALNFNEWPESAVFFCQVIFFCGIQETLRLSNSSIHSERNERDDYYHQ